MNYPLWIAIVDWLSSIASIVSSFVDLIDRSCKLRRTASALNTFILWNEGTHFKPCIVIYNSSEKVVIISIITVKINNTLVNCIDRNHHNTYKDTILESGEKLLIPLDSDRILSVPHRKDKMTICVILKDAVGNQYHANKKTSYSALTENCFLEGLYQT